MRGGVAERLGFLDLGFEKVGDEPPSKVDSEGRPPSGPDVPSPVGAGSRTGTRPVPNRRTLVYVGVVVVVVVAVSIFAYAMFGIPHSNGTSGVVLVPAGTGLSLPAGQFSGFEFTANSPSVITGTLNSSEGVQIYLMTPQEFQAFIKTTNVSGYGWTSGWVANDTIYTLDIPVPLGQWYLVLTDPNVGIPTGIGIYTDIVVKAA